MKNALQNRVDKQICAEHDYKADNYIPEYLPGLFSRSGISAGGDVLESYIRHQEDGGYGAEVDEEGYEAVEESNQMTELAVEAGATEVLSNPFGYVEVVVASGGEGVGKGKQDGKGDKDRGDPQSEEEGEIFSQSTNHPRILRAIVPKQNN